MELSKWSPWNWFKHEQPVGKGIDVGKGESLNPATRLHSEIDRMFGDWADLFGSRWPASSSLLLKPKVDIEESKDHYTISLEVPGVDEKQVHVQLDGDTLTIKGEKKQVHEEKKENYHCVERQYGAFQRVLSLPADADQEKVRANFKNGVLILTVAKQPVEKLTGRHIEIEKA